VGVDGPTHLPGVDPRQWVAPGNRPDPVAVSPPARRMPGVETVLRLDDRPDRYLRAQHPVQRPDEPLEVDLPVVGERDHLTQGVDTGVGSTRHTGLRDLTEDHAQRSLQFALDRSLTLLTGVSPEPGAVIGEVDPEHRHR